MRKILITGANSYIGTSFEKWVANSSDKYYVDTIDMMGDLWKDKDFSEFDVVFHVAGIAHIKETEKNQDLYYNVNRDLAFETAKKAKVEGVKQFIFLSSMSVYGIENGIIDSNTPLKPNSAYGKSKLQAEELIKTLEGDSFKVAILRPPMVYGKGCKGNYPRLAKLALNAPAFPDVDNERSMIYIDNLCEFVRLLIHDCVSGLYFPQNNEYVKTSEMVRLIAEAHGKKLKCIKMFNLGIQLGLGLSRTVRKVFGSFMYDKRLPGGTDSVINGKKVDYQTCSFENSIRMTEK